MHTTKDFCCEWKPSHKSTLAAESKNEWDAEEGTGKSMKNVLYVQWYGKRHLFG